MLARPRREDLDLIPHVDGAHGQYVAVRQKACELQGLALSRPDYIAERCVLVLVLVLVVRSVGDYFAIRVCGPEEVRARVVRRRANVSVKCVS